jgi:predicted metalloprotease with PDZ domain
MKTFATFFLFSILLCLSTKEANGSAQDGSAPITVAVDATEAPRGIFHARLVMPVAPGPLTLLYPKWIPGEHGPTGPIVQMAGLKIAAGGAPVPWQRDGLEMYAFNCVVPPGAHELEIHLDYLSPVSTFSGNGYGFSPNATAHLADVLWNHLVLYPAGHTSDDLRYRASLRLPPGWKFGTALPVEKTEPQTIDFEPVSLTTLIDSPVIAGEYFRSVPLALDHDSSVQIDMVADSAAALEMISEQQAHYHKMVLEANALFGARHYRHYHFLLTLSDAVAPNGLEHHESSDDRVQEQALLDPAIRLFQSTLLPHEYTHSCKYRRPLGLATPDYQQPMNTELLWVYEGLTQYLGDIVLTARSGLYTPAETQDLVAYIAALLDVGRPGRQWRPLVDTATAAQLLYAAPDDWAAWRRGVDFYDEGLLIWLEADTIIRSRTAGQRSLDDFCRGFYGGQSGPPLVKPYTFDDVVSALNDVAPYDWRAFLRKRVYDVNARAPFGGVEGGGWRLTFSDSPNSEIAAREQTFNAVNLSFSIGISLRSDGTITDIVPGLPAYEAGLGPGMKIVAVNGSRWSSAVMHNAMKATKTASGPLELLAENGKRIAIFRLNYHGGEKYPHLERDNSRPDLLAQIIRPLTQ